MRRAPLTRELIPIKGEQGFPKESTRTIYRLIASAYWNGGMRWTD
jgi:hypothetical protein